MGSLLERYLHTTEHRQMKPLQLHKIEAFRLYLST